MHVPVVHVSQLELYVTRAVTVFQTVKMRKETGNLTVNVGI